MPKVDENKRKFLRHLGLLGIGALLGLGIAQATSPTETQIINDLSNTEIKRGKKIVWNNRFQRNDFLYPPDQYDVRVGGLPIIKENACAYHIDENGDGKYEKSEELKYCTMPCQAVCPVDAITKHENADPEEPLLNGKVVPLVDSTKCIGCTKCFRICGYYAIDWSNEVYD
jgi:ferredoxin